MKNKILLLIFMSVIFAGCEDFLTNEPLGQMTQEQFDAIGSGSTTGVNTQLINAMDQLLLSCYDVFTWDEAQQTGLLHNFDWYFGDFLSDDAVKGGDKSGDLSEYNDWREWKAAPGNGRENARYIVGYVGVQMANNAINNITSNRDALRDTMSANRLLGEGLFLRGYWYFDLALGYGSVPDKDDPSITRGWEKMTPAQEYAKIETDLKKAISLLPTKTDLRLIYGLDPGGKATKATAQGILAKVIMMEIGFELNGRSESDGKSWKEVYDLVTDIINSGQYSLLPNFAQFWTLDYEQSNEAVFEINCVDRKLTYGSPGGNLTQIFCSPRYSGATKNIVNGWGFDPPSLDLVAEFETGDPRFPNTCIKTGDVICEDGNPATDEVIEFATDERCPTGYFQRKNVLPGAHNPQSNQSNLNSDLNKRLLRYADIILIAAEAAYHIGNTSEAQGYVNMIRDRARNSTAPKGSIVGNSGYPPKSTTPGILPAVTATGTALLDAIKHERRIELALEGHRTWDLYRWGVYEDAIRRYVPLDKWLKSTADEVIARYRSHLVDGKIPAMPIPKFEVDNNGVLQNPGY